MVLEQRKKGDSKEQAQHIPRQALGQSTHLIQGKSHEPRVANGNGGQKAQVVVKQTPAPEVRIYGQKAPRKYTIGMKAADKISKWAGSWAFIIAFFAFLFAWMLVNVSALFMTWDPYPFILLNLVLSCLAAVQAPVILMSQNRAADRDRAKAERDYAVNRKSEREVENMQKDLDHIKKKLAEIAAGLR